jgi:hypothetical protein
LQVDPAQIAAQQLSQPDSQFAFHLQEGKLLSGIARCFIAGERAAPLYMSLEDLINEANDEYKRHEMRDLVLLDGTSQMHARNALDYLSNQRWPEALSEAQIAAKQRSRWEHFATLVAKVCNLGGA